MHVMYQHLILYEFVSHINYIYYIAFQYAFNATEKKLVFELLSLISLVYK